MNFLNFFKLFRRDPVPGEEGVTFVSGFPDIRAGEERWKGPKCDLCGAKDKRLSNWDICTTAAVACHSFCFNFCEECEKNTAACDDIVFAAIEQAKEDWLRILSEMDTEKRESYLAVMNPEDVKRYEDYKK